MTFCLVYISSFVGDCTQADLDDILAVARRNNAAAGITGILLFHDGNFLQVMEGEQVAVEASFRRIERDHRHTGCIVLQREPAETRHFGQWAMSYIPFDKLQSTQQDGFLHLQDFRRPATVNAQGKMMDVFVQNFLAGFTTPKLA